MERRWSERRPVEIDVEVYCCGQLPTRRLLTARTRDISFGGMFLRTGGEDLPRYREVILRFPCNGREARSAADYCTVRAHAVYRTPEGVAVRFDRLDVDTVRMLRNLMRAAPREVASA